MQRDDFDCNLAFGYMRLNVLWQSNSIFQCARANTSEAGYAAVVHMALHRRVHLRVYISLTERDND